MRGSPIGPATMLRELARLLEVFSRPKQYPADDGDLAKMFAGVCADVSCEQVTQAVNVYLRGAHRFFPKPGELRGLALEQPGLRLMEPGGVGGYWAWERGEKPRHELPYHDQNGHLQPCPACDRAWATYPRLKLIHDHARHKAQGLPCIGYCDVETCIGPGVVGEPKRQSEGALWPDTVPDVKLLAAGEAAD